MGVISEKTARDYAISLIANSIHSKEIVLFVGAGISLNSGIPIVYETEREILKKLDVSDDTIDIIWNSNLPFESFMQTLIHESGADNSLLSIYECNKPNTNHRLIAKLARRGLLKTIVTTNFDQLIEKALDEEGVDDYFVLSNDDQFKHADLGGDAIKLIKLHGSIEDKDSLAVTLDKVATKGFSSSFTRIIKYIFSGGEHKSVLILGYSSSDIFDITPLIESIETGHKDIYYISHISSNTMNVVEISTQTENNPFRRFSGMRVFCNTDDLIKTIWKKTFVNDDYRYVVNTFNWEHNVDQWIERADDWRKPFMVACLLLKISEYRKSIPFAEKSLKAASNSRNEKAKEAAINRLGGAYLGLANYKRAIGYFNKSLSIAKGLGDKKRECDANSNLGTAYSGLTEYVTALKYYEEAYNLAIAASDIGREGLIANNLGGHHCSYGRYEKGKPYFLRSLDISRKQGDKAGERMRLFNLGHLHLNLGEFQKASEYCTRAIEIANDLGDKKGKGTSFTMLGNVYRRLGKYNQAIEQFVNAKQIAIDIDEKNGEMNALGDLGSVYIDLKEYDNAYSCYYQALEISREIGNMRGVGLSLHNIGLVFSKQNEYTKAIDYYDKSLAIFSEFWEQTHPYVKQVNTNRDEAIRKQIIAS